MTGGLYSLKQAWTRLVLGLVVGVAAVQAVAGADYRSLGYTYLSPLPGAEYTSPRTAFVLVRFQNVSPTDVTNLVEFIHVTGAATGVHTGQTRIAMDQRTVIFQNSQPFQPYEIVTVSLAPNLASGATGTVSPFRYQFAISGRMTNFPGPAPKGATIRPPLAPRGVAARPGFQSVARAPAVANSGIAFGYTFAAKDLSKGIDGIMPNGVSVPSDFPRVNITVNNNPDPDYIFLNNWSGAYDIIFDNHGSPVWYTRVANIHGDLRVQPNGLLTLLSYSGGMHFKSLDNHYRQVTNYWAGNGYSIDDHELQVLADGSYYLIALNTATVDMTQFIANGNPAASVTENILQGFSPAGQLVFQWRAWDHLDILDQEQFIDLTSSAFDFPHMNAIDIDTDGNLLLSSRNTSEITKIDRNTGAIIWRLGGGHNQFTFVNDPLNGPRNQHAIRMVTTNDYTLFDNGNLHSPSVSRGVEYVLDPIDLTATLVWQYPPTPTNSLFSWYMGNVQRLTNGNTLINWAVGSLPKLTEVRPDGTKAFEMNWVDQWQTYRTWRCPWQGSARQPYLIVETYPDNVTLIFNQFGDTNVAFYKIYGGTVSQSTNLLAISGVTLARLVNFQNNGTYYFRVTGVNQQGVEGPFSNEASATVNFIKPGQNMVQNGDFSQGTNFWIWTLSGGATAAWAIEGGVSHFYITNGTTTPANIQLKQTGYPIVQGRKYVFQFDAWASTPRYIQAMVAQDGPPNLDYSGASSPYLTPIPSHFRYVFTMNAATDFDADVLFNLGSSSADVFLDNVSLFNPPPGDINLDGRVDLLDLQLLTQDWMKQQSGLSTDLDGSGKVDFKDFGILGENWSGSN